MRYVVAILLVVVVVLIFDRQKTVYDFKHKLQEEVQTRAKLQSKADSIQNEIDLLLIHYRNVSAAYRKAIEEELKWQKKYELEKKRKVGILTDAAYDSVLNRLYPR